MEFCVFISQPMGGRTLEEVKEERENIITILKKLDTGLSDKGIHIKVIDSFDEDAFVNKRHPLLCMSDCLARMADADVVVFAPGWDKSGGCKIEHLCAETYHISTVMLKDKDLNTWLKNSDTEVYNR